MGARASAPFLPPVPLLRPCSISSRGLTPLDSAHLQVHVSPHPRAGLRPQSLGTTPRSPASREPPPRNLPRVPLPSPAHTSKTLLQSPPSPYFHRPIPLPSRRPPAEPPTPPHPRFETLPAAGSEPQASIPSPNTLSRPGSAASSDPGAGVPWPRRRPRAHPLLCTCRRPAPH